MIKKTVLDCGLVVISEYIPAFPSFSLSYTLRGGSRVETTENNGIHHLIEHMLFKGSESYNLKQIADISDRLGGNLNAFTGKETTMFYLKAIDEKLEQSFHLLSDIVMKSLFPEDEFYKERMVVLQELKESDDNPESYTYDVFCEEIYPGDPMGYPIAGKMDRVSTFKRDSVYDYYKKLYSPENFILTAVGKVEHQRLVQLAEKQFKGFPSRSPREFRFTAPVYKPGVIQRTNDSLNQVYATIGFESPPATSLQRHRFAVLNDILGGGLSSRLFQVIREEKGLSYTVHSFSETYLDCGLHQVYAVLDKDKIDEYLEAVRGEILHLKKDGICLDDLERSRDHMKASVIMGMEGSVTRMQFHVANEMYFQREVTLDEILEDVNRAGIEDINRLFHDYLDLDNAAIMLYGDISSTPRKGWTP